jgi:hypothetical protein
MPQPLFSIPLDAHGLDAFRNADPRDTKLVAEKAELLRSPNHGAVDEAAKRLDIFIELQGEVRSAGMLPECDAAWDSGC